MWSNQTTPATIKSLELKPKRLHLAMPHAELPRKNRIETILP